MRKCFSGNCYRIKHLLSLRHQPSLFLSPLFLLLNEMEIVLYCSLIEIRPLTLP